MPIDDGSNLGMPQIDIAPSECGDIGPAPVIDNDDAGRAVGDSRPSLPPCSMSPKIVYECHAFGVQSGFPEISEAAFGVHSVCTSLEASLASQMMPVKDHLSDCEACISGQMERSIDFAADQLRRPTDRVQSQLLSLLGEAQGRLASIGINLRNEGEIDNGEMPISLSSNPAIDSPITIEDVSIASAIADIDVASTLPSLVAFASKEQEPIAKQSGIRYPLGLNASQMEALSRIYKMPFANPGNPTQIEVDLIEAKIKSDAAAMRQAKERATPADPNAAGNADVSAPTNPFADASIADIVPTIYRSERIANWCSPGSVADIEKLIKELGGTGKNAFSVMAGLRDEKGSKRTHPIFASFLEKMPSWTREPIDGIVRLLFDTIDVAMSGIPIPDSCSKGSVLALTAVKGVLDGIERWTGLDMSASRTNLGYSINYACQSRIETEIDAREEYLRGVIDLKRYVDLCKANGICEGTAFDQIKAAKSRLNTSEATAALMRDLISPTEWAGMMRANGFIDEQWANLIRKLAEYVPTPSDLIPWMTRDVFDPNVVRDFRLDDGFEDKFKGRIVEWAKANGMDKDTFIYHWRAHWQLPSPTQTYEMLHRLRPGVVNAEIAFTKDDAKKLLEIADVAPAFQERMLAISYHPLTRTDARRAYFIGTLDEDELHSVFMDLGYDEGNANKLVRFYRRDKARWERNQLGLPTPRSIVGQYAAMLITESEMETELKENGFGPKAIGKVKEKAILMRRAARRKRMISDTKSRYLKGMINIGESRAALIYAGLDAATAEELLNEWSAVLGLVEKEVSATQLCKWYGLNLIKREEYIESLIRIGYSSDNAKRLASECGTGIELREEKAADKAEKEVARLQAKLSNGKARSEAKIASDLAKAEKAAEKIRSRIQGFAGEGESLA